jgi:hypothetical protein
MLYYQAKNNSIPMPFTIDASFKFDKKLKNYESLFDSMIGEIHNLRQSNQY